MNIELVQLKEVQPQLHVGEFIYIESLIRPFDGDEDERQELNIKLDNYQALCLAQEILSALKVNTGIQLATK